MTYYKKINYKEYYKTKIAIFSVGGAACRILMFFRAFGLYLSSFILVVISLDRYFAILHPMSLTDADRRGRIMIMLAWAFSFIASIPQVSEL